MTNEKPFLYFGKQKLTKISSEYIEFAKSRSPIFSNKGLIAFNTYGFIISLDFKNACSSFSLNDSIKIFELYSNFILEPI